MQLSHVLLQLTLSKKKSNIFCFLKSMLHWLRNVMDKGKRYEKEICN